MSARGAGATGGFGGGFALRGVRSALILAAALAACAYRFDRTLAPGEVRGRLVMAGTDGTRRPAAGAAASLLGTPLRTSAGEDGRFAFRDVPAGRFTLVARAGRDHALALPLDFTPRVGGGARNAYDLGNLEILAAGAIAGVVSGPAGPAAGARVVVQGFGDATADAAGAYRVDFLPAGSYQAVAVAAPLAGRRDGVVVRPRAETSVDFALAEGAGSISGVALLAGREDSSGIAVVLVGAGGAVVPVGSTARDGAYAAPDLPAGVYTLRATMPGFLPATLDGVAVAPGAVAPATLVLLPCPGGASSEPGICPCLEPGSRRFLLADATQNFTVPEGCGSIRVRAWGAGGGAGSFAGGAGGFAEGTLTLAPGTALTIMVGGGGGVGPANGDGTGGAGAGGFAGGGASGTFSNWGGVGGGGGGGFSGVFFAPATPADALLIAGGGGGGGAGGGQGDGGPGGGASGGAGTGSGGATGGTEGAGGTSRGEVPGTDGSALQGGTGASTLGAGGGGGGGHFGGGGGGHVPGIDSGGGGGGSGFAAALVVSGATTPGSGTTPPQTADPSYAPGIGAGGVAGGPGGDGLVVLSW